MAGARLDGPIDAKAGAQAGNKSKAMSTELADAIAGGSAKSSADTIGDTSADVLIGLSPVVGQDTRLVVLGSFPGAASLRAGQYYAHPRNHFWPILGAIWGVDLRAMPYEQRLCEMLARGLGLWDVYASCQREGSLDSAIVEPRLNDLASLKRQAPRLQGVAHNGGESARVMRHTLALGLAVSRLPSTSPANASWSFERKLAAWRRVLEEHHIA